jgi:hypothetical protein
MLFRRRVVEKFVASLLAARAGGRGRRCGRLWCKTLVDEYDTVRGSIPGLQPDLPIIALTNINACPIALDWDRFAGFALPSLTQFSGCPQFVASRTYQVRGIPVHLGDTVFGVPPLVQVCKPFLNGLPTDDWPLCRNSDSYRDAIPSEGADTICWRNEICSFCSKATNSLPLRSARTAA